MKRYICSRCGYSRTDAKKVVRHVDDSHTEGERAVVKEVEVGSEERSVFGRLWSTVRERVSGLR